MTDEPDSPAVQSLGEAETIARSAGTVADVDTSVEDAAVPDDQPRGEIETATTVAAAAAVEPAPGFEERTEGGLLPGEVVGVPAPPAGPYQFGPGDGQAEGQDERNAEFAERKAELAEAAEDRADDKAERKAEKAEEKAERRADKAADKADRSAEKAEDEAKPKPRKPKKEQD